MRIVMIGAHGKVAQLAAPLLVAGGHEVTSWIRDERQAIDIETTGATPVVVDIERLDADGMAEHLAGHDVVVWSAGAGGGDPERTRAVDRDAAIASMDAASSTGVGRYVMVSYFGAGVDHGVSPKSGFHAYAEAKAAADAHLRASDLAWTILGPSGLTSDPGTAKIEVGDGVKGSSVSRADVAAVISAVLEQPGTVGKTIDFNSGRVAIDTAIARLVR